MVEILKLIPQISVAAVALLSLFTVGYFSKIGIHLLGVIDVTNLVYSFGLAFGFVAFVVAVVNADSAKLLRKAAEDNFFLPFLVWLWRWIMLPLLIVGYFLNGAAPKFAPPALTTDDSLVAVLMMACILLTAIIFVRYEKHDKIYTGEMSGLVIIFLVCVYNVGRVQAQSEVFSNKNLYDVSVKDSTIRDAHLLRSSSSGFIFAIEGVVTYLPKDVVLALNAKNRIEK